MEDITIPSNLGKKFKPSTPSEGGKSEAEIAAAAALTAKTAADDAAQKAKDDAAAAEKAKGGGGAGGGTPPDASAGAGTADDKPVDFSLLEGADEALVTDLERILATENEADVSEADQKILDANLELVRAIANQEGTPFEQLRQNERYVESGEFEETAEGYQNYQTARDAVRDKEVITNFLDGAPKEVKDLYEHVVTNKHPINTFMAQVNRPPVLDVVIGTVKTDTPEVDKNNILAVQEEVVRINLTSTGMDKTTIDGVITAAKAGGTLEGMAKSSQESMKTRYSQEIETENTRVKGLQDAEIAKAAKEMADAEALIKTGKLTPNISIPKVDEANFIAYLKKPINDKGQTMADIKYNELSLEERTAIDYIVYKGLKLPNTTKSSVLDKYRIGKKNNDSRKPTKTSSGGATSSNKMSLGKLNLRKMAEDANAL